MRYVRRVAGIRRIVPSSLLLLAMATVATAQQGDRANDPQQPLPKGIVPNAVVRDAKAAQASFVLPEGFAIECFAKEPLVGDPIAIAFDADGRCWVVEMRGFMNDVDGHGEREPNGCIAVLEDTDGDGTADRRTVFRDHLVMPRAVLPLRGGALVIAPPNLCWCPDADGDLVADGCEPIAEGFTAGLDNPEHAGNGLLWGLDHRIHLAGERRTWRWTPTGFVVEQGAGGGQWGITQDDRGRLYFDYNEDWLRCDLVPSHQVLRVTGSTAFAGLNHRLVTATTVWPNHRTPGVNRGYQQGRLRDYVLASHTAVCGPQVYRGDLLPGCDGDAFVCEPAGNVVRRIRLREPEGLMRGDNAYEAERREFLASDDERFRPVNAVGGPDGALYIVDMYRGVIQHRVFLTTYLRQQIEDRGLAQPTGLGRIWRIVPADGARRPVERLAAASPERLVNALASPVGAVRDAALRELVQRRAVGESPRLRALFAVASRPAVRIAVLAALDGLGALAASDVADGLGDKAAGVRGFALERATQFLVAGHQAVWQAALAFGDGAPAERWRLALALGETWATTLDPEQRERALGAFTDLAAKAGTDALLRDLLAAITARGRGPLLAAVLARSQTQPQAAATPLLQALGHACLATRDSATQGELLAAAATLPVDWQQEALLAGAVRALPAREAQPGWLALAEVPDALATWAKQAEGRRGELARTLLAAVATAKPVAAELDAAGRELVARGAQLYPIVCGICHQPDGVGLPGLAPPLRDSEWVRGAPERVVRIVLGGLRGPIEVDGTSWSLEMPAQRHLDDAMIAGLVSYVRQTFGGGATVVAAAAVAAERAAHAARTEPWTAGELAGAPAGAR